jgi:hypothetical protein
MGRIVYEKDSNHQPHFAHVLAGTAGIFHISSVRRRNASRGTGRDATQLAATNNVVSQAAISRLTA